MDPNRLKGQKHPDYRCRARAWVPPMPKAFAAQGANVCLGDLSLEEAQEVADRIKRRPTRQGHRGQDGCHQAPEDNAARRCRHG